MTQFPCQYLKCQVELTAERENHIAERHPDLLPKHRGKIADTLADPDQVRRSARFGAARLFTKWYNDLGRGKHVVVVVASDFKPRKRHWIITSYIARSLAGGEVEWNRD